MIDSNKATDLYILKAWLENRKLDVELREHPAMRELIELPQLSTILGSLCGPHQLIVTSEKGQISVIRGQVSFGFYEIYSLNGDLFEDIERFNDVKSAGERICELLQEH